MLGCISETIALWYCSNDQSSLSIHRYRNFRVSPGKFLLLLLVLPDWLESGKVIGFSIPIACMYASHDNWYRVFLTRYQRSLLIILMNKCSRTQVWKFFTSYSLLTLHVGISVWNEHFDQRADNWLSNTLQNPGIFVLIRYTVFNNDCLYSVIINVK